mmetsp:Transcript_43554/g.132563  ORF Transcript_43554/g.132563 Transcript_43554/m.132563 type:complete len:98 (-) Transcript_43554:370-663(-)
MPRAGAGIIWNSGKSAYVGLTRKNLSWVKAKLPPCGDLNVPEAWKQDNLSSPMLGRGAVYLYVPSLSIYVLDDTNKAYPTRTPAENAHSQFICRVLY